MNKHRSYLGLGLGNAGLVEVGLAFVYTMAPDVVTVGRPLIGELEPNECNLSNGDPGGVIWTKILI